MPVAWEKGVRLAYPERVSRRQVKAQGLPAAEVPGPVPPSGLGSREEECLLGQPIGSCCCYTLPGSPAPVALPTCLRPPTLAAPLCQPASSGALPRPSHLGTPPEKTKALCLFSKPEPEAIPGRPSWLNGAVSGAAPKPGSGTVQAALSQAPLPLPAVTFA